MQPIDQLIMLAAVRLEEGGTIDGVFLRENAVTLNEAIAMTVTMAVVLKAYLKAPQPVQTALLLSGLNENEISDSIIWSNAARQVSALELERVLNQLKGT